MLIAVRAPARMKRLWWYQIVLEISTAVNLVANALQGANAGNTIMNLSVGVPK